MENVHLDRHIGRVHEFSDTVTFQDASAFVRQWWKLALLLALTGMAIGLFYAYSRPPYFESTTFIPIDATSEFYIQDIDALNASLAEALHQPVHGKIFATSFFQYLDQLIESKGGTSAEAQKAKDYFRSGFLGSVALKDEKDAVIGLAAALAAQRSTLLAKEFAPAGKAPALYLSAYDASAWRVFFRADISGVESAVAAAAGFALAKMAPVYNSRILQNKAGVLQGRTKSAQERYLAAKASLTKARLENESEKTRLKVDFYRLLIDASRLDGNAAAAKGAYQSIDLGTSLNRLPFSNVDLEDVLLALGVHDLSKKLAALAESKKIDDATVDKFLARLAALEAERAKLRSKTDVLEETYTAAKNSYESSLALMSVPIDASEFSLPLADTKESVTPELRTVRPSVVRYAGMGLLLGIIACTLFIFVPIVRRYLQRSSVEGTK